YLRPDGKTLLTVTGLKEQTGHFWDLETGKEVGRIALPPWDVRQAIDPGGTTLALPDADDAIRLYDLTGGEGRGRLAGHKGLLWLTFSADGRRLASTGLDRVVLWDVAVGKDPRTFRAEGRRTDDGRFADPVELSPDGALLAARCGDGQLRVW